MKILMITMHPLIPNISGYTIRMYNILKCLKEQGVEITLISFCSDSFYTIDTVEYNKICNKFIPIYYNKLLSYFNCLKALFNGNPFKAEYFYNRKSQNIIDREIQSGMYDYICGFYYHTYLFINKHNNKKWIDLSDSFSMQHMRYIKHIKNPLKKLFLLIEGQKVLNIEKKCLKNIEINTLISEVDKDYLNNYSSKDNLFIIKNGVDIPEQKSNTYNLYEISYMGDMAYIQNIDACLYFIENILPELAKNNPKVIFKIIGNRPPRKLQNLCKNNRNIKITGFVKDVKKELVTSHVMVCPIRISSGLQNKVIESLAIGVPVIATTSVIKPITDKSDIIICAENKDDWINKIQYIFSNTEYRKLLSEKGCNFIKTNYTWDIYTRKIYQLLMNANK